MRRHRLNLASCHLSFAAGASLWVHSENNAVVREEYRIQWIQIYSDQISEKYGEYSDDIFPHPSLYQVSE